MENVNLDLRKRMFLSERTIFLVYVAVEKNYLPWQSSTGPERRSSFLNEEIGELFCIDKAGENKIK